MGELEAGVYQAVGVVCFCVVLAIIASIIN